MRPLHLGIGLSVVLHGLAVSYAVTHPPARPVLADAPADSIELVAKVEPPIDIVFLDEPEPEPAPGTGSPAPVATGVQPRSISTGKPGGETKAAIDRPSVDSPPVDAPPTGTLPTGTPPVDAPSRVSPLAMRTGPQRPVPAYTAAYDMEPGEAPPPETPKSGHLKPVGGGRMESDQDVFTMHVAEDGSVEIEDAPAVEVAFIFPLPIIVGRFDVTDIIMRARGEDPYARRKLKILDETREERYEMGVAYKQKQYRRTPQILRQNLEYLFASKTDPTELKEALFQMWDECIDAEEPGTEVEEAVGAGLVARKLVIGAIHTHFPADSADAYTEAELAAFNRKRASKLPFAPYAD